MQQESPNGGGGFQSRGSYRQRLSNNMSIDRFALRAASPSLHNPVGLIDAMDIEQPDRKSDLYENILGDGNRNSNYKRNSNISRNDRLSNMQRQSMGIKNGLGTFIDNLDMEDDDSNHKYRLSSQRQFHECNCEEQCNQEHCACFLYTNQMCIIGLCCENCIKYKNQYLAKESQIQTVNVGCLCKNIKCLKMYCSCYREGRKCIIGLCKCEGCENDCDNLIQSKKKKMEFQQEKKKINSHRQNFHLGGKHKVVVDKKNYSFLNCACKKSHCLKKYCSCHLNGRPCNECCTCEDCYNKFQENESESESQRKARFARFGRHESDDSMNSQQKSNPDIDQYLDQQEDYEKQQMNQNMEFDPVNFQDAGKWYK